MTLNQIDMESLVKAVVDQIYAITNYSNEEFGTFSTVDQAVEAAYIAQKKIMTLTLENRQTLIDAMREGVLKNEDLLAEMAVKESGMGRVPDKILKNRLAAQKTPGTENLKTEAFTGDRGLTIIEMAPYGVIGSITPVTNPVATIINNSISMIAAGNSVVFCVHPNARAASLKAIEILNRAILAAGGPGNLLCSIKEPSLKAVEELMAHPKINLLSATGGPGVVRAVLSSGKKAIGAGAGNPPAVVDETADIEKAARDIIAGCSFDNNLPCIAEKSIIVVGSVADKLIYNMKKLGAVLVEGQNLKELEKLVLIEKLGEGHGKIFAPNKQYVGKNARCILEKIGINVSNDPPVIIAEVDASHPFVVEELMMPVLPIVQVKNIDEAIVIAVKVEHGNRHTATMHSKNVDNMTRLAKAIQTTIFVKNAPSYAGIGFGGEGFTTFTIAGPTGEGLTSARTFTRQRRCVLVDAFSIV
ncbi:MAG: aldehyde dehydrogenase [Clostridiaceae bacterium BRH_c20a]|nr:MAG: aldehyde dehydrogenase [Clostridiaceae bacterium BRH_c20a]